VGTRLRAFVRPVESLTAEVAKRWDVDRIDAEVRASQRARADVDRALRQGRYRSWDHQPTTDASQQYMRNHLDLNDVANAELLAELADSVVESITTQGFAHDDEYASDRVAAELMMNAGYRPGELHKVIGMIPTDGGAFSHHPTNADRRKKIIEWKKETQSRAASDPFAVDPTAKELKRVELGDEVRFLGSVES